jgi:hypothetical protein
MEKYFSGHAQKNLLYVVVKCPFEVNNFYHGFRRLEQFEFGTWELVKGSFYFPVGFSGEIGTCDHQAVPVI